MLRNNNSRIFCFNQSKLSACPRHHWMPSKWICLGTIQTNSKKRASVLGHVKCLLYKQTFYVMVSHAFINPKLFHLSWFICLSKIWFIKFWKCRVSTISLSLPRTKKQVMLLFSWKVWPKIYTYNSLCYICILSTMLYPSSAN